LSEKLGRIGPDAIDRRRFGGMIRARWKGAGALMIRLSIATIAGMAVAALVGEALAAAPIAPAPVMFNWTGFYVGLNAGGNWGTSDSVTRIVHIGDYFGTCGGICSDTLNAAGLQRIKTHGFTGGIQVGYNWQFGNIVTGVEADFEYFRSAGKQSTTATIVANAAFLAVNSAVSTDWLFTLRPRLGFAADDWLFYGTGGLAVAQLKASWSYSDYTGVAYETASASVTKAGWVAGGGIETALPGNWIVGAEYLYVKFDSVSTTSQIVFLADDDRFKHSADLSANIVRARVSKKF